MSAPSELVVGLYPTGRGFGWTLFEGPNILLDWGLTFIRKDRKAATLRLCKIILERHRPEVLVLERFDPRTGRRSSRVADIGYAVGDLAHEMGVEVRCLTRKEVRKGLGLPSTATRDETAARVAEHIAAIRHRLPDKRRPWDSEDRRMALFNAAALVLASYSGKGEGAW